MALDFPSSPTNGQVYGNYYYNSARGAWNALLPAATPNFFTGAQLIDASVTSSAISTTPLTVIGLSGQTANLQEWKNSAGTDVVTLASNGAIVTIGSLTVSGSGLSTQLTTNNLIFSRNTASYISNTTAGGYIIHNVTTTTSGDTQVLSSSSSGLRVNPSSHLNSGTVPMVVKGSASQTADLQQWQSSTGAVLSDINSAGELQVPRIGVGATMPTSTRLMSTASAATEIPILARGAASQTANLQEWQNSSTTLLSRIDPNGSFITNGGVTAASSVTGTTPVNGGTSGGVVIRTPASGTQTSAYLQFVNNANTVEYASIAANPSSVVTITGKVTMPQQPVYAGSISNYTSTTSNYFPATVDIFNIGFSKSGNNRLTAQVAGKYFVSAQQLVNTTGTTAYFHILKNGSSVAYAYSNADDTYDLVVNALVDLQVNDYIELYYGTTTTYSWPQPHSYYSVFKVS